jgi:hypothetical protein
MWYTNRGCRQAYDMQWVGFEISTTCARSHDQQQRVCGRMLM